MTTLGGWLSARILPHLDFELIREFPKIHIGYSDIVSLILGIYHRSGLVTFHGPAVLPELGEAGGPRAYTIKQMLSVLMTPEAPRILSSPSTWTDEFLAWGSADIRPRISRGPAIWTGLNAGRAEGPLLGGCLPTVEMLYGTPYFPSLKGSILFLEHEAVGLDQFCAHLTSFRLRNVLDDIAGLMFGRLSRPDYSVAPDVGFREVAVDCLGDCDIPIAWNVDFGHTQPKLTLPIGTRARLEVLDEEVNLTLLETAVV
jgi:muramoyltetrapeptide carboxypeptidase LdcA involved in peptidoglycan recycling